MARVRFDDSGVGMKLACCVAAAVALGVLGACRPQQLEEASLIDGPMRVSFGALGWSDDVTVQTWGEVSS